MTEGATAGGRQGNAILTRYDIIESRALLLDCARKTHFHCGFKTHTAPVVRVLSPLGEILCYSLHFDPKYAGVDGRVKQYLQVLQDVHAQEKGCAYPPSPPQIHHASPRSSLTRCLKLSMLC